jgi:phage-related protein
MSKITCLYYSTESGKSEIEDFIGALDLNSRRKFYYLKELLEEFGHRLVYPHAKYIGDQIFELRFQGKEGALRVLYFFFFKNQAILKPS